MKTLKPLTLALAAALTSPAFGAGLGVDVNDVAVLFPLDAKNTPSPYIALEGLTADAPLLGSNHLQEILAGAALHGIGVPSGTTSFATTGDWNVVAFRYDPCAAPVHGPEVKECVQELRLVAQPHDSFGPADTSLHLIYQLGEGEPAPGDAVLADLLALKKKAEALTGLTTDGKVLGVHPLLTAGVKSQNAEVAKAYEDFVRKYAKPEALKKLTMMGLANGSQTHWIFFGGDIINGTWTPTPIPNLSDDPNAAVELDLNSDKTFTPQPLDIQVATFGFFHRELLEPGDIQNIRTQIHRIENPAWGNRNTIDCLSCHSATSLHVNPNSFVQLYVPGLTAEVPKGITAYPDIAMLNRHRLHWNMHSLGYFGTLPTLSMRTVFESGVSADQVNQILKLQNPGPDCSAVQQQVMTCFVNTSSNVSSTPPTPETCMASCAAAPTATQDEPAAPAETVPPTTATPPSDSSQTTATTPAAEPEAPVTPAEPATPAEPIKNDTADAGQVQSLPAKICNKILKVAQGLLNSSPVTK